MVYNKYVSKVYSRTVKLLRKNSLFQGNWLAVVVLLLMIGAYANSWTKFDQAKLSLTDNNLTVDRFDITMIEAAKYYDFATARFLYGRREIYSPEGTPKNVREQVFPQELMVSILNDLSSYISYHPLTTQALLIKMSYLWQLGRFVEAESVLRNLATINPNELPAYDFKK